MREAIFILHPAGEAGPQLRYCPVDEAKGLWKAAVANPPEGIEFVEVWTSDEGCIKRKNLTTATRLAAAVKFGTGVKAVAAVAKKEANQDGPAPAIIPPAEKPVKVDPDAADEVPLAPEETEGLPPVENLPAPETPPAPPVVAGPGAEEVVEQPAPPVTPPPVEKVAKPKRAKAKSARKKT